MMIDETHLKVHRTAVIPLSEGEMSDYKGAALMLHALPKVKTMTADRGYDAGWLRHA